MKQLIKLTQNINTHWLHWHNNDPFDSESKAEDQYYKMTMLILEKAKIFMSNNPCGDFSTLTIDPPPGDYLRQSMLSAWNCTGDIVYASGPVIDEPNCLSVKFFQQQLGCHKIAEPRSLDQHFVLGVTLFLLTCLMVIFAPSALIKLEKCLRSKENMALLPKKRQNNGLCSCFFSSKKTSNTSHMTYGTDPATVAFKALELEDKEGKLNTVIQKK